MSDNERPKTGGCFTRGNDGKVKENKREKTTTPKPNGYLPAEAIVLPVEIEADQGSSTKGASE